MKLMIAGSRGIGNFDLSPYITADVDLIITGGADGVDALAEAYADAKRLSKLILRPQYARYGRGAPIKRNQQMVELADEVLIVWDGISRGTAQTLRYVQKIGKPYRLLNVGDLSL